MGEFTPPGQHGKKNPGNGRSSRKDRTSEGDAYPAWGRMDDFYAAVVQAPEEAVPSALIANSDMIGRDGNRNLALPHAKVVAALKARGAAAR